MPTTSEPPSVPPTTEPPREASTSSTSTTSVPPAEPTEPPIPPADKPATLDEIVSVATPEQIEALTPEQADQLIAVVETSIDDLSPEEQAVLAETLSKAPDSFKKQLESKINVYGGGFDQYVPSGSTVTVGQRRTVGAAIVGAFVAPAAAAASRRN